MNKNVKLVLKIVLMAILLAWTFIIFFDYYRTRIDKKPVFCLKEETYKYDDGEVYECIGAGYKMYSYNRDSIKATEFGPIFITQRSK